MCGSRPAATWESIQSQFPSGWSPDFLVLNLSYATIPPAPLVGADADRRARSGLEPALASIPAASRALRRGADRQRRRGTIPCGGDSARAVWDAAGASAFRVRSPGIAAQPRHRHDRQFASGGPARTLALGRADREHGGTLPSLDSADGPRQRRANSMGPGEHRLPSQFPRGMQPRHSWLPPPRERWFSSKPTIATSAVSWKMADTMSATTRATSSDSSGTTWKTTRIAVRLPPPLRHGCGN